MSKILIAALLICSYLCCKNANPSLSLDRVDLITHYPIIVVPEPGVIKLITYIDTTRIYTFDGYKAYQLFPTRRLVDDEKIPGTQTYFVFRPGNDSGHLYTAALRDSLTLDVDTVLKYRAFANSDFSPSDYDSLLESKEISGVRIFRYFMKHKIEGFLWDSSYYYMKPGNQVPYHVAPSMDRLHQREGKKVFKIRLICNEKFSTQAQAMIPKNELSMEVKKVTEYNPKVILELIRRYKKQRGS